MPSLTRVSDNNGLIFAGSSTYQFYIELWGQGFADQQLISLSNETSVGSITVNNGAGGYTKLLMLVPFSYTLQIRPKYYLGGSNVTTDTSTSPPSVTTSSNIGGQSAGFAINGEWMAVAGGAGLGGYIQNVNFSTITANNNTPYNYITYSSPSPGGNGLGGYNVSNPLATPQIGGNSASSVSGFFSSIPGTGAIGFLDTIYSGSGGAGSPRGNGGSSGLGGDGGGANIKIWSEQQKLDGYLTSFPDIKMSYIESANGINESISKVRITSKSSGSFIDYTTNQDVLVSDLPSILG